VNEQWNALVQLFDSLFKLLAGPLQWLASWLLLLVWIAWWLWAVDWRKAWPVLAQGAWVPVVLLLSMGALVWSRLVPDRFEIPGVISIGNFWYQLIEVALLAGIALFCGWIQGIRNWAPPEIDLEPPTAHESHGDEHGHPATSAAH
jgi:hypothetical protein